MMERLDEFSARFRGWLLLGAIPLPLAVTVAFTIFAFAVLEGTVESRRESAIGLGTLAALIAFLLCIVPASLGFLHHSFIDRRLVKRCRGEGT